MASGSEDPHKTSPTPFEPRLYILPAGTRPSVPPGLEPLLEVDEVILKKKVFWNRSGQILFHVYHDRGCCDPSMHFILTDPKKHEVITLEMMSGGGCCRSSDPEMQIEAPPFTPIGHVTVTKKFGNMTFTILDMHSEFTFTAELNPPLLRDKPIEILSMNGSHPVAQITMTKEKSAKAVNFQFPKDMDAKIKAIILGAFLFMNECLSTTSSDHSSSSSEPWANAVGVGHFGSNWGHDAGVGGGCHSGGGFHSGGGCGGDW